MNARTCSRCSGTVLPPSRSGAFRGTCVCPQVAFIRGRASLSTDLNPGTSYVYEVQAPGRGIALRTTTSIDEAVRWRDEENALALDYPDKVACLEDGWAVRYRGMIEGARWRTMGPADAHLQLLQQGVRKPQPETRTPSRFDESLFR